METIVDFFRSLENRYANYAIAAALIAIWWVGNHLLRIFREGWRAGRLEQEQELVRPRRRIPLE